MEFIGKFLHIGELLGIRLYGIMLTATHSLPAIIDIHVAPAIIDQVIANHRGSCLSDKILINQQSPTVPATPTQGRGQCHFVSNLYL